MAPITTQFDISHSQYYLVEMNCMEAIRDDMYVGFNGLISAHEFIAVIMTGTENGHVSITADWRETEPLLDLAPWDDVVEVSMTFDEEPGCLAGMNETDGRDIPDLPAGTYRVRVHARGRDRGWKLSLVPDEPVEGHLLQAWPAPAGPEVLHKLTDQYGAMIRAR
jgi:hypothetical protein